MDIKNIGFLKFLRIYSVSNFKCTFYRVISRQPSPVVICNICTANVNPLMFNMHIVKKPINKSTKKVSWMVSL